MALVILDLFLDRWRGCLAALWQIMIHPTIRPASAADIPAVTTIYAHAVKYGTATFEIEPPSEREMADRFRALAEGGFPYVVAARDGKVLGYAYAGPYRTRIAYRYSLENSIYVALDCHRHGIGRALMDELLSQANTRGFRQMIAVIGDSQQVASIALHRAAGFNVWGRFGRSASNLAGGSIPCSCSAPWVREPRHCHSLPAVRAVWCARSGITNAVHAPNKGGHHAQGGTRRSERSIARSTRSSSCPRRTMSPVAEITL
jgi:phosphinothricin acetyltransferase